MRIRNPFSLAGWLENGAILICCLIWGFIPTIRILCEVCGAVCLVAFAISAVFGTIDI